MVFDALGDPVVPVVTLTNDEATLLQSYKKFLRSRGLQEALYCQTCGRENREDGCRAHVTATEIVIKCRCRELRHHGLVM